MSLFAILFALLLEQLRPLPARSVANEIVRGWADWVCRNVDAGRPQPATLAWIAAVGVPVVAVLIIHLVLDRWLGWPLALLWNVLVLYMTLGFRQFSHPFTAIRDALDSDDEALARRLLSQWKGVDVSQLPSGEMVGMVIEHSVISAHRHVFGVLVWHSALAAFGLGPSGAVFYRMVEFLQRRWSGSADPTPTREQLASSHLARVSGELWWRIDWLPARITALGFAVVGSFEDAIDRWRSHARKFPQDNDGLMLAATAGAMNIRLVVGPEQERFPEPQLGHLTQLVGLIWRTVVMWVLLLALLTLAHLVG